MAPASPCQAAVNPPPPTESEMPSSPAGKPFQHPAGMHPSVARVALAKSDRRGRWGKVQMHRRPPFRLPVRWPVKRRMVRSGITTPPLSLARAESRISYRMTGLMRSCPGGSRSLPYKWMTRWACQKPLVLIGPLVGPCLGRVSSAVTDDCPAGTRCAGQPPEQCGNRRLGMVRVLSAAFHGRWEPGRCARRRPSQKGGGQKGARVRSKSRKALGGRARSSPGLRLTTRHTDPRSLSLRRSVFQWQTRTGAS